MPGERTDEKANYAVCPMCGYKTQIIARGSEQFQTTALKKITFSCMRCGAPLAPHDNKEAFDAAPDAPSESEPRLKVEKKDITDDSMDS